MDAGELVDFGTIRIVNGDVKAAFFIFYFKGLLSLYN